MTDQEHLFYTCEGNSWEMFSDNSHLSAILDRQGLRVATPVDLRTKKTETFYTTVTAGLLVRTKEKSKDRCDVPNVATKSCKQQEVTRQQHRSCLAVQNNKSLAENTSWRPETEEFGGWRMYKISRKMPQPQMDFLQHLLRPLQSILISRERMVLTEWQFRTTLEDLIFTIEAPECALINDFLDWTLTQLECARRSSTGHELDRWSTWRVKASKPCGSSHGRTSDEHVTEIWLPTSCTLLNRCESLGSRKQYSWKNPWGNCKDFFQYLAILRRQCFAKCACPMLPNFKAIPTSVFCQMRMSDAANFKAIPVEVGHLCGQWWIHCQGAPLEENPFKINWREGLSCSPVRFFQHRMWPTCVNGRHPSTRSTCEKRYDQFSITAKMDLLWWSQCSFSSKASWTLRSTSWTFSWITRCTTSTRNLGFPTRLPEMEQMDASEIHAKRLNATQVLTTQRWSNISYSQSQMER